jgi:hypothetical protein
MPAAKQIPAASASTTATAGGTCATSAEHVMHRATGPVIAAQELCGANRTIRQVTTAIRGR